MEIESAIPIKKDKEEYNSDEEVRVKERNVVDTKKSKLTSDENGFTSFPSISDTKDDDELEDIQKSIRRSNLYKLYIHFPWTFKQDLQQPKSTLHYNREYINHCKKYYEDLNGDVLQDLFYKLVTEDDETPDKDKLTENELSFRKEVRAKDNTFAFNLLAYHGKFTTITSYFQNDTEYSYKKILKEAYEEALGAKGITTPSSSIRLYEYLNLNPVSYALDGKKPQCAINLIRDGALSVEFLPEQLCENGQVLVSIKNKDILYNLTETQQHIYGKFLIKALKQGCPKVALELITLGADVNYIVFGDYALKEAVKHGYADVVAALLSKSCRLVDADDTQHILHIAAQYGHANVIEPLSKMTIEKNGQQLTTLLTTQETSEKRTHLNPHPGRFPSHIAAQYGHVEFLQQLIPHGVDLLEKSHEGLTPFELACLHGKEGVVKFYLQQAATLFASNDQKKLLFARPLDYPRKINLLLKKYNDIEQYAKDHNINSHDNNFQQLLFDEIVSHRDKKMLITYFAIYDDVIEWTDQHKARTDIALQEKKYDVFDILIEKVGIASVLDIPQPTEAGKPYFILQYACKKGLTDIVKQCCVTPNLYYPNEMGLKILKNANAFNIKNDIKEILNQTTHLRDIWLKSTVRDSQSIVDLLNHLQGDDLAKAMTAIATIYPEKALKMTDEFWQTYRDLLTQGDIKAAKSIEQKLPIDILHDKANEMDKQPILHYLLSNDFAGLCTEKELANYLNNPKIDIEQFSKVPEYADTKDIVIKHKLNRLKAILTQSHCSKEKIEKEIEKLQKELTSTDATFLTDEVLTDIQQTGLLQAFKANRLELFQQLSDRLIVEFKDHHLRTTSVDRQKPNITLEEQTGELKEIYNTVYNRYLKIHKRQPDIYVEEMDFVDVKKDSGPKYTN